MNDFFDHDAERRLIGSAMLGRIEPVDPQMFHDTQHRSIWRAILDLQNRGEPVSPQTISDIMGDKFDDLALLTGYMLYGSSLTANLNAERVRYEYNRRGLIALLENAARQLNKKAPVESIISDLQASALQFAQRADGAHKLTASEVVDRFLDRIAKPRDVWGIRCGIGALDHEFGGIHKNQVVLIAGEPGVGKSIFTTQLGFQMAGVQYWEDQIVERKPGAMYHLEMDESRVLNRAISAYAHVSSHKAMTGKTTDDEQKRWLRAAEIIHDAPVWISDR
ncbi:MAG: hypothetical protein DRJ03_01710, partial [Chloroflexi bacterium]